MRCPMTADGCGIMSECYRRECAWWDNEYKQCCIKTVSIAPVIVKEKSETTDYRHSWVDEMLSKSL